MNVREAEAVIEDWAEYATVTDQLSALRSRLDAKKFAVTRGPSGSVALFEGGPCHVTTPAAKVQAVDVCGAGDAFLAGWAAYGENSPEAMRFANDWAGLATTLEGSAVPRWPGVLADLSA